MPRPFVKLIFFFFNDTATTEIYTLSLHDALPISTRSRGFSGLDQALADRVARQLRSGPKTQLARDDALRGPDRKSTRLNSSHTVISYAVFCLKKKNCLRNVSHSRHYSVDRA